MISGEDPTAPRPFPGWRPPRHASTFPDQRTAERLLVKLFNKRAEQLDGWMSGPDARVALRGSFRRRVGRSLEGDTEKFSHVRGIHAVLVKDASMPEGWRVHTAYPVPTPSAPQADTPGLAHLLGAYFHQDWAEDHADQTAAVDVFIAESPSYVARIPSEVARVVDLPRDEAITEHLDSLGCEFSLRPGESYAEWLEHVAERCRAAVN